MPLTLGIFNSTQAESILEQALQNPPDGIKIRCKTPNATMALRHRLNYFRKQNRLKNKAYYKEFPGHPLRDGSSVYDALELVITRDEPEIIHIRHRTSFEIEIVGIESVGAASGTYKPAPAFTLEPPKPYQGAAPLTADDLANIDIAPPAKPDQPPAKPDQP